MAALGVQQQPQRRQQGEQANRAMAQQWHWCGATWLQLDCARMHLQNRQQAKDYKLNYVTCHSVINSQSVMTCHVSSFRPLSVVARTTNTLSALPNTMSVEQRHSFTPEERDSYQEQRIAHALANRVDRILLVLERCTDNKNYLACLRTCDILGVQRVWIVEAPLPVQNARHLRQQQGQHKQQQPPKKQQQQPQPSGPDKRQPVEQGRLKGRIARGSSQWLDVRQFSSSEDCLAQLKAEGWTVWATDLAPGAVPLNTPGLQLPQQLAIVMGSERSGVSPAVRAAADRCVYLPMFGFTESLNVSVAAGLVLQALIAADPSLRGRLLGGPARAAQLAAKWRAAAARGRLATAGSGTDEEGSRPQLTELQQQPGE